MDALPVPDELLDHLVASGRLDRAAAEHLVREVLAYFDETPQGFVSRRHAELQAEGLANQRIYARLARELNATRFAAPPLSERQIRRLIYG